MSGKLEIQWSPINRKFITWGADINLYQIHYNSNESVLSAIPASQCKFLYVKFILYIHIYFKFNIINF